MRALTFDEIDFVSGGGDPDGTGGQQLRPQDPLTEIVVYGSRGEPMYSISSVPGSGQSTVRILEDMTISGSLPSIPFTASGGNATANLHKGDVITGPTDYINRAFNNSKQGQKNALD